MNAYRRIILLAIVLAFGVILMGAYTRLNYAGLACPDWPGCFGEVWMPTTEESLAAAKEKFNMDVEPEKAALEMIHRYMATVLGMLIMALMVIAIMRRRRGLSSPLLMPIFLFVLVCFQGALGMWTVTKGVSPPIVTAHLLGGLSIFGLLIWHYYRSRILDAKDMTGGSRAHVSLGVVALLVLTMQLALGGWTSTNFGLIACSSEFPTCNGSIWPEETNFAEAFTIWKPLGPNYELPENWPSEEARNAIQLVHRIGALITLIVVGLFALLMGRRGHYGAAAMLFGVLCIRLTLGILTAIGVGKTTLMATAHNGGAALLLFALIFALTRIVPRRSYH